MTRLSREVLLSPGGGKVAGRISKFSVAPKRAKARIDF
jgi:hypothetical protein